VPADAATPDLLIFWLVVSGRLLLPLLIPSFPLPAILACLGLDAIDQTIFQEFTDLDHSGYQGYDKSLDIYYLTIAYLSTLRNWTNLDAVRVGWFLFYYRLAGVVLFELLHARSLLLVFPNTFEYFFIVYEAIRLRWDPRRLSRRDLILLAAGIWLLIKLPQEYWIHIAKLDTTDLIEAHPWIGILGAVVIVFLLTALRRRVLPGLPKADHSWRFPADPIPAAIADPHARDAWIAQHRKLLDWRLVEKIVLVGFVCVIFAQILPGVDATNIEILAGNAVLIMIDSLLGLWTARRSRGVSSMLVAFLALAVANSAVVFVGEVLDGEDELHLGNTLFFVLLLTLIVTLYDRYEPFHGVRFQDATERETPTRVGVAGQRRA
jgi:hypothetical protein